jgi:hypothetical protein
MSNNHFDAVLTGYAYETIPNRPIVTGQTKGPHDASVDESNAALTPRTPKPATLGALALGARSITVSALSRDTFSEALAMLLSGAALPPVLTFPS